jgi:cytochrome c oxidase cbb3-type subunit 3
MARCAVFLSQFVPRQAASGCALALALVCVCGAQIKKPSNPLGDSPQVAEAGRLVYNKTCTGCHGPDGGEGDRAPALDANRRYFRVSEAAIFDVVKNGIPGTVMPASGLPDMDVWKVVAFIRNVRATASDLVVPGNVQNGMTVFTGVGNCSRCHMIRGQGGVLGPDLSSIGAELNLKKLNEALTKERPVPNGYRPVTVTTLKGEKFSGVARNSDAFSLQLLDEKGALHMFETKELRNIAFSDHSLMPHNYDKVLSAEQYRDLIAMLAVQARTKVRPALQGENEIGR